MKMNSNDHLRDERLEEVVSYFRRMKVPTRPLDVDVLASLHIRYEVASQSPPFPLSSRRRYLTHIVIPSAAASLLFVSGLGIFSLQSTSGLALADVLEATETHKLVRYKMEQSTQTIGMTGRTQNTVYLDLETPRARTERASSAGCR